jgi:hypothetical protein
VNHLGIQVESATELGEMQSRLEALQTEIETEEGAACCYAKSDKHWVNDPSGLAWETFHTLDTIPVFGAAAAAVAQEAAPAACCVPAPKAAAAAVCCPPAKSTGSCC